MRRNFFIILFLILLCIPAISALFHPGFFQSDDGEWMVIRFSSFYQMLREGQFPIRFLQRLNFGYGYPVANFLYPAFMYLGIPLHILGIGFVNTIKILFGISIISSGIFTYLWLSRVFDKWSAIIGSLVYIYTPYHLYNLYKRGSMGELLALSVLPFLLWQLERRSIFWTAIGVGFLIMSHNTLAFLFLPLIIVYPFIRFHKKTNIKNLGLYVLFFLLFGLGLSMFFWFPALRDLQYTKFSQTSVSDPRQYFVNAQLVGICTLLIVALAGFSILKDRAKKERMQPPISFVCLFLLVGLEGVLFSLPVSSLLWQLLPIAFIQFPFRFLSLTIVAVSFLAAFVSHSASLRYYEEVESNPGRMRNNGSRFVIFPKKNTIGMMAYTFVVLVFLALSALPYIQPKEYFDKSDVYYATNEGTTTVKNEYMPKWVQDEPQEHPLSQVEPSTNVSYLVGNTNNFSFKFVAMQNTTIRVNKVYFPGWEASVDGQDAQITYNNPKGIIQIPVPSGEHIVHVHFEEVGWTLVSDIVSLVSFIMLLAYCSVPKILYKDIKQI